MNETAELSRKLKKELKDSIIILGGGHITSLPYETMQKYPEFDIGIIGEGEETLKEILLTLEDKKELENVKGIIFRKSKEIIKTEKREYIKDLDKLNFPAWDLLPNITKYYIPPADGMNRFPSTSLITSRGCPGKCIFCNLTMFGNTIRYHSVNYTINMIKHLIKNYKIKEIFFQDDTFVVNKKILRQLCERMINENLKITWSCYGRVDMVDFDTLKIMKKAGCWQISYGIETGSQEILNFTKKNITIEQIKDAIKWTRDAKINAKGTFMLGNFLESKETINKTINLIKKLNLTDFHMTYFTPFPGSLSYEIAKQYGEFDPDWSKLDMFTISFIPKNLTKKELQYYYKKIYKIFYLRPKIIFYYIKKIFSHPKIAIKLITSAFDFLKFTVKT
jgi:radical SAM superfamily enzyme YgiQ (UPF0313 family)